MISKEKHGREDSLHVVSRDSAVLLALQDFLKSACRQGFARTAPLLLDEVRSIRTLRLHLNGPKPPNSGPTSRNLLFAQPAPSALPQDDAPACASGEMAGLPSLAKAWQLSGTCMEFVTELV